MRRFLFRNCRYRCRRLMCSQAPKLVALLRGEASVGLLWDSLTRTLRSTGTIIWVTVGAAALAGADTVAN